MSHSNSEADESSSTSNHRSQPCNAESSEVVFAYLPESKLLL